MNEDLYLADCYFLRLATLSQTAKLYLIRRLADSLLENKERIESCVDTERDVVFHRLAGAWVDDPEAELMASFIEKG